jgi:CheY-like chemotaxis protein
VLDISRFDAGAVKPELTLFHLQDILTPLAQEFAALAKQKGLDLRIMPSRLIVHSDRKLLRRILQNLISNAIKYTPKGRVLVGCKRQGTSLFIKIYDTGLGIPETHNKTIFLEFERLGRDKGETPGLGLGLSIVERMCAVLRHPLKLSSEINKGSVFSVAVPIGRGEVIAISAAAPHVQRNSILKGLRVLAVDNEVAIVEGLRALLSGWGVEVVTATSSAHALLAIKPFEHFDAILADYHINDDDGIELVAALRRELGQHTPAILITADRSLRVRDLALAQGLIHLRKPVKPAALRAALSQVTLRKAAE